MMRTAAFFAASALLLAAWVTGIPVTGMTHAAVPAADLTPWQPDESWPGGAQYDPRLDQPVQFWRAGIPLRDVFAGVKDQTGVDIAFHPPGDDNERICVNLYLNPASPATLRDLVAQLSWVTDCTFAYAAGDAGRARYTLLGTSAGSGVRSRLEQENREDWARAEQRWKENRKRVVRMLDELRPALDLSREEAIERYKESDDLVLLALLDPGRRALVEFLVELPKSEMDRLVADKHLKWRWEELTPRQRSLLGVHFEANVEYWYDQEYAERLRNGAVNCMRDLPLDITLGGASNGFLWSTGDLRAEGQPPLDIRDTVAPLDGSRLALFEVGEHGYVRDELALCRLLGETRTAEGWDELRLQLHEEEQTRHKERRRERAREAILKRMQSQCHASPGTAAALAAIPAPEALDGPFSLWQIQELIASRSGIHVLSDCFWQPQRDLSQVLRLVRGDEATALLVLQMACASTVEPERLIYSEVNDDRAGWEWGDAGEVLRFRSLARDLWRAAVLPEQALQQIDAELAPPLQKALESRASSATVEIDLRRASQLAADLTSFQLQYGGRVMYGDPTQDAVSCAYALREAVLDALSSTEQALRCLARFSDHQWASMAGRGLKWDDLTPEQQATAAEVMRHCGIPGDDMSGTVVRLAEGGSQRGRGRVQPRIPHTMPGRTYTLRFETPRQDERPLVGLVNPATGAILMRGAIQLARTITVPLERPRKLSGLPATDEGSKHDDS